MQLKSLVLDGKKRKELGENAYKHVKNNWQYESSGMDEKDFMLKTYSGSPKKKNSILCCNLHLEYVTSFNDTSTKAGLIQECESQVFGEYSVITGSTDNLLPTFTRNINEALNRVTSLILQSDARWQFDDTNNTDLPIGLTTLTTDQQDYSLSVTHLTINRVEILDANGNWQNLNQLTKRIFITSLLLIS